MRVFLTPLASTGDKADDDASAGDWRQKDWQLQFAQLPSLDDLREVVATEEDPGEDVVFYLNQREIAGLPEGLDAESALHLQYGARRRDWHVPDAVDSEKLSDWISAVVQISERSLLVGIFDGSLYRVELSSRACRRIRKFPAGIARLCPVRDDVFLVGLQSGKFAAISTTGKERGIPESMARCKPVSFLSSQDSVVSVGFEDGCVQEWTLSAGLKWSFVKEMRLEHPIKDIHPHVVITEQSIVLAGKAMQMKLQRHISCADHTDVGGLLVVATGHPSGHINVFGVRGAECNRLFTLAPEGAGWITDIRVLPAVVGFAIVAVGQDGFLRCFDATLQSGTLRTEINVGCKLVCLQVFPLPDSSDLWVHVGGEDCIVHSFRLPLHR